MTTNYLSTLSKFDPEQKNKFQVFKRKPNFNHTHCKRDFFDVLETLFIYIFIAGFCIVFWVQVFIAVGR